MQISCVVIWHIVSFGQNLTYRPYGRIDAWMDDLLDKKATRIGQVLAEPGRLTPLDHLDELARVLFGERKDVVNEGEE